MTNITKELAEALPPFDYTDESRSLYRVKAFIDARSERPGMDPDQITAYNGYELLISDLRRLLALASYHSQGDGPTISAEEIDRIGDLTVKAMPDGLRGFAVTWGWQQFSRTLVENLHPYGLRVTFTYATQPAEAAQDYDTEFEQRWPNAVTPRPAEAAAASDTEE